MADDADPDWHAGSMTYPVRVLFILFEGGVGGAIGYAAAFALDLSTMWTVVTVAALATLGPRANGRTQLGPNRLLPGTAPYCGC